MRPLIHPAVEDITVEGILHALSDPVRVAIFTDIAFKDCTQNCSAFSAILGTPIPKSTLSQHFRILREAGLIRSERIGVEMHNISRCEEVDKRFPGLLNSIAQAHEIQLRQSKPKKSARRSPR
ncbi:ArsR/SmtB family transcription factor [Silvibacterium acidisoli]|uniref:ArsR/SmtB family transcription factor n=1 Tax=Acidobacteriaceae bacterium ZG23-2 TaxID=2883246 RepID=UPI00406D3F68